MKFKTFPLRRPALLILALTMAAFAPLTGRAESPPVARVSNSEELLAALRNVKPGARVLLAPGEYKGGISLSNLRGEPGKPVVIAAAEPENPPRFTGGGSGLHLVDPFHVELRGLEIRDCRDNGLNIDDGGRWNPAPRGIVLKGLRVSNIGPKGNHDGIKLSGITGIRVEDCVIENWGSGNGSGVDMVGCHDGVITGCLFRHHPETERTGGNGVQTKGGCDGIVIRGNRFEHAGLRALNVGGSTGFPFFRPPLERWPEGAARYEAANITVEGNVITGSQASIAFVGVDGAVARFNTIIDPGKWFLRVLQETRDASFAPCRNAVFSDNLVVFRSDGWSTGGVNIGSATAPETFRFERNHWWCADNPAASKPRLPSPERDGVYGVDPLLTVGEDGAPRLKPGSPARDKGAGALPKTR